MERFLAWESKANGAGIQSPRFWAMRMVLSDRNDEAIGRQLQRVCKSQAKEA